MLCNCNRIGTLLNKIQNFAEICKFSLVARNYSGSLNSVNSEDNYKKSSRIKSWEIHSYGGREGLTLSQNSNIPIIKSPTDVLIEVKAASVNPIDLDMSNGYGAQLMNIYRALNSSEISTQVKGLLGQNSVIEFPLVLGRDFSGTVVKVGQNVKNVKVGQDVYGFLNIGQNGAFSQFILASSDAVRQKPISNNFCEATCFPYVFTTLWSTLRYFGNFATSSSFINKNFLILGGSGGVGTIAIQYLKANNANVITTCSSNAMPLLETLLPDAMIDYSDPNYMEHIKKFGPYDCVLDLTGPINTPEKEKTKQDILKNIKPIRGQYITLNSPLIKNMDKFGVFPGLLTSIQSSVAQNVKSFLFTDSKVVQKYGFFLPCGNALDDLSQLINNQKMKPIIDQVYKFDQLPEAFQKIESGHLRGKIVIDFK